MPTTLAQIRSAEARAPAGPNGHLSPLEAEAIGLFIQLGRMVGQPRSFAEVYGILFVSPRPLPVEDLVERLGASRASADRALRFLRKAGLLRMVYVPGDRRMHYEAVAEPRHMVVGFLRDQVLPQLANAESGIDRLAEAVRRLPGEERSQLSGRVARLQSWGKKSRALAPMILRLLGS
jgi:HTH-type transcriptional regulator, glycine betaine synthesis regulator